MIAGYCWPQSGVAGDSIDLAMSSDEGSATVVVSRVGRAEQPVLTIADLTTKEQPVPDDVAVNGCQWAATLSIDVDPEWTSGFYLVRMSTPGGETAEAFFVVRASEPGDTLLVLSTSTWAAYNDWGGPSFYTGGHRSSQLRPLPRGFLDKPRPEYFRMALFGQMDRDERRAHFRDYSMWSCAAGFANWERLFVEWAEREGVSLDYATSLDLAGDPELLAPYKLYLSVGHDEYWSASMRDQVETWADGGGHAAFFSGNTSFWQIRFEPDAHGNESTQVVGYKLQFDQDPVVGTAHEASLSTMWSDPLVGRPESQMTGVTFTRGGYAHCNNAPYGTGGYTVWQPNHWVFDGVDLRAGDVLGGDPVIVGYECDGCELQLVDGLPQAVGSEGTPDNFEVLATAPAHLWATEEGAPGLPDSYVGELNWVAERLGGADTAENRAKYAHGSAVLGAYTRGSGSVFTSGCTDWAYGLTDPAVARVTRNVIDHGTAWQL